MKRILIRTLWTGLICLSCGTPSPTAEVETGQLAETLNFTTSAGLVSAEAENFSSNTGAGTFTWIRRSETSASGGAAMLASPDNGTANNTGFTTTSPRLNFVTTFAQTGTYYVWVRGRDSGATLGNGDSVHVGMDGQALTSSDRISGFTGSFGWTRATLDNVNATISVTTTGQHTINVWMREDGFVFDKLVLTTDASYTPTGSGPAETAQSTSSCTDGVKNGNEIGVDCGGSCAACPSCGDGTCSATESCSSCASDCGVCSTWTSRDIGAVAATGSMTQSGGTFTLVGSGDDIHSTYGTPLDEFQFAYQQVSGDFSLVARVVSVQNTNEWAKAGVMVRETLTADSKFAFALVRPDKQTQAQFRAQTATTGTDSGTQTGGTTATKWVKVERAGDQFRTYYSTNGTSFTQLGTSTTISMAQSVYVGLAVTSHVDGTRCTAQLDNVTLSVAATCGNALCDGSETCTSCPADCGPCGTSGLDSRPVNTTCVAPAPLSTTVGLQDVWSSITFSSPMQVVQPPGNTTRLIVVERAGKARSVPINATLASQVTDFLSISNVAQTSNGGFLSMAFHPKWPQAQYLHAYVVYTIDVAGNPVKKIKRLSRFTSTDNGATLSPGSEQVVLEITHLKEFNHNGGQVAFGKDGYLYMSSGDDAYTDYARAAQAAATNNLFGKVLRINVDSPSNGKNYAIPTDNPFATGGGSPEVYAYGLRNPWRFSFDRTTGNLWLADVGESKWEEVNIIQKGGFYGWPIFEGEECFNQNPQCAQTSYLKPAYKIQSGGARSISGGFVYRGAIQSLQGKYVYGDYVTSEVSVYDPATAAAAAVPGSTTGGAIVGFGEDNAGELYVVRFSTGRIQKIIPQTGAGTADFPQLLSATGCFDPSNPTKVVSGAIPYTVAQPFWSDRATKDRYLALPAGQTLKIDADGDWELPPGAVTIKNFSDQGKLFETRFFVRHTNGTYSAYTYEWNDAQTQATLVPAAGKTRSLPNREWTYPSRSDCAACHTSAANYALGLETRQLNVDSYYPSTQRNANQVYTLDSIGMLSGNRTRMTPLPGIADASVSLNVRAEAYLHVNCSNCHRPGALAGIPMDLRFTTPLASKNICNKTPTMGDLGLTNSKLIAPGDPYSSVLWHRMNSRGAAYSMPPLASKEIDVAGSFLLQGWISQLTTCPL
jgi:uncharacterized repeat protein (TIGR03806 family)